MMVQEVPALTFLSVGWDLVGTLLDQRPFAGRIVVLFPALSTRLSMGPETQ